MKSMYTFLTQLSRTKKRVISVIIDILFIVFSLCAAFGARLGNITPLNDFHWVYILLATVITTIGIFVKLGLYRAILRYLTFQALYFVAAGAFVSAILLAVFAFYFNTFLPRTVPIIYFSFLVLLCGGSRLVVRAIVHQGYKKGQEPVLIYGAGSTGRELAFALRSSEYYRVISFIDNDRTLIGNTIQGLRVEPLDRIHQLIDKHAISKVLLAIPNVSPAKRKEILNSLVHLPVEVFTIPAMKDIVSGKARIDQFTDVPIEDLLGRDSVYPQQTLLEANIKNKVVMVTGAGGSIGSELCRQILNHKPSSLILFERSEFALYQIEKELAQRVEAEELMVTVVPLLGSVQRINRLVAVMQSFGIQTIYHAAAYKHVPLVECNVVEGVRNNIFGTYYTATAAIEASVESFVLISTDKAVRPTNIMGATKRMAELVLQALAEQEVMKDNGTCFSMVRFGNVLGSSGSVIPVFKKQIKQGGPVTVTHPDITRYFMTIPEAAQLVIQAGAMGKGGDVFVLDMGEAVKIVDLAKNLIYLSGLEVKDEEHLYGDIEIQYTGLRLGEKLYEELLISDNVETTAHERIMTANENYLPFSEYKIVLDKLDKACHNFEHETIRQLLVEAPTDFNPVDGICDLVYLRKIANSNS